MLSEPRDPVDNKATLTSVERSGPRRARAVHRTSDTPDVVVLGVLAAATASFVVLRWLLAAHHELSRFVVAGSAWANPTRVPHSLYVFPNSSGFDGQFYWRMAVAPTNFHLTPSHGVSIDLTVRFTRILYPLAAYAVSLGHVAWVPLSLVLVNGVALVALGALGIRTARSRRLSPWWGLSLLLIPGLFGALSRDLTDLLATTLVVAGVLAMRQSRWLWAALAWSGAVLTRETALAVVASYAGYAVLEFVRKRNHPIRTNLAWVVPVLVAVGWQVVLRHSVGSFPILQSANNNVGPPFVGLFSSVTTWFTGGTHGLVKGALFCLQLVGGLVLIVVAIFRRGARYPAEVLACAVATTLVLCGTSFTWPMFDFRTATDAMALAWLVVLDRANVKELRLLVAIMAPIVALTILWRIVVI